MYVNVNLGILVYANEIETWSFPCPEEKKIAIYSA